MFAVLSCLLLPYSAFRMLGNNNLPPQHTHRDCMRKLYRDHHHCTSYFFFFLPSCDSKLPKRHTHLISPAWYQPRQIFSRHLMRWKALFLSFFTFALRTRGVEAVRWVQSEWKTQCNGTMTLGDSRLSFFR